MKREQFALRLRDRASARDPLATRDHRHGAGGLMTAATTVKTEPVHVETISAGVEWILDFAPAGVHEPIVSVGRFTTEDEAKTAAEVREGRPLVWAGPDASYRGLIAAGSLGYWLLLPEERVVPLAAPARGRPRRERPDAERMEELAR